MLGSVLSFLDLEEKDGEKERGRRGFSVQYRPLCSPSEEDLSRCLVVFLRNLLDRFSVEEEIDFGGLLRWRECQLSLLSENHQKQP